MNWQEALEQIQSVEFDINLNVASSTDAFYEAVAGQPAVLDAYRLMRSSGDHVEDVLGKLRDLTWAETDPRYENPNDSSLAALLWLTNFAASDYATIAATWVDQAPRCWHSKKLAQRILNPPPSFTGNLHSWAESSLPTSTATTSQELNYVWARSSEEPPRISFALPISVTSTAGETWETTGSGTIALSEGTS